MPGQDKHTGTKKPRSRRKLVAMIATCGLILASGIAVASVTGAKASAEETTRLCAVAIYEGDSATKVAVTSTAAADNALEAVKSTKLPKNAGTSAAYAKHPAAKAVTARAIGADFIGDVARSRAALVGITIPTECIDRAQADGITSATGKLNTAAEVLDTSVDDLLADFTAFQADETKRIAVEKKVADEKAATAKKKAAADASAKKKAEEEATAAAAEVAAAAVQQVQQVQQVPQYTAPEPASGGGGYEPAPAPYVPAPALVGGGGSSGGGSPSGGGSGVPSGGGGVVGSGGGGGVCWTSNGMGGTKPC